MDLNSRVDARVVANVNGRTGAWMDGKRDPYIGPCLRQVQQKVRNFSQCKISSQFLGEKCCCFFVLFFVYNAFEILKSL